MTIGNTGCIEKSGFTLPIVCKLNHSVFVHTCFLSVKLNGHTNNKQTNIHTQASKYLHMHTHTIYILTYLLYKHTI